MEFILYCSVSKMAQTDAPEELVCCMIIAIMDSNLPAYLFVLCSETKKRLLCYTFWTATRLLEGLGTGEQ